MPLSLVQPKGSAAWSINPESSNVARSQTRTTALVPICAQRGWLSKHHGRAAAPLHPRHVSPRSTAAAAPRQTASGAASPAHSVAKASRDASTHPASHSTIPASSHAARPHEGWYAEEVYLPILYFLHPPYTYHCCALWSEVPSQGTARRGLNSYTPHMLA